MTDDELDLIASAYLDGEATPEEVAMVERDADLAARVEAMRSVSEGLAQPVSVPTPAMKERHLAAALAEFDSVVGAGAPPTVKASPEEFLDPAGPDGGAASSDADVIDLQSRPRRSSRQARRDRAERDATPRTFPRWLSAAAGLVVLGGGVVFVANQASQSSDDAAEVATEAFEAADEAGETADTDAAAGASQAARAEQDLDSETAMEDADAAAAAPAESVEEDAGDEAGEDTTADDAVESEESDDGGALGGLFPNEPQMTFDAPPDADEALAEMPDRLVDVSRSNCGASIELPAGSELIAFLPIEIADEPAELFVVVTAAGEEIGLIVDADCDTMTP